MTYHRVCNQIDTAGATSGAGTAYLSGAPELTHVLVGFVSFDLQFYVYVLQIVVCPLCCLFFCNVRTLSTPLVSSNSSSKHQRGNQNPYIEDEQKTQLSNYILPIFLQEMITSTPLHLRVAINLEQTQKIFLEIHVTQFIIYSQLEMKPHSTNLILVVTVEMPVRFLIQ